MSQKKSLKQRALKLIELYDTIEHELSDTEFVAYLEENYPELVTLPINACIRCGSVTFKEIIDEQNGKILCCNDCPDSDTHH